jgi:putative ABC transport system permease protein
VVPLLAGLPPVLGGTAITVREALATYGIGADFHAPPFDRWLGRWGNRLLPAHYAQAFTNTFRRKKRLLLTQAVLIMAGAMFLMVMSLSASLSTTLDHTFERRHYDASITFSRAQSMTRIQNMARAVPGVAETEFWFNQTASMLLNGRLVKEAGIGTNVLGVPDSSGYYQPLMVDGRWLQSADGRVLIMPRETAEKNHLAVGDSVLLDMGELGKESWTVVGLYEPVFAGAYVADTLYAPAGALYSASHQMNQARTLYVRTSSHDVDSVRLVTAQLKDAFERSNIRVSLAQTAAEARSQLAFQFSITLSMMISLAVVVAVVGGIALAGALSISVVERTKEIGVLRAIGARSWTISGMMMMEGVVQGLISWMIAVPIAFLAGRPFAEGLGKVMFSAALDYQFNFSAMILWLFIILALSVAASILPARSATRVSVRESLAYA